MFACSSLTEMERWMNDIRAAVETASTSNGPSSDILSCSLTNNSKSPCSHLLEMQVRNRAEIWSNCWRVAMFQQKSGVSLWLPSDLTLCCAFSAPSLPPPPPHQPNCSLAVTTCWLSQNATRTPRRRRSQKTTRRRRRARRRGPRCSAVTPWCTCAGTGTPACPWWTLA